MSKYKVGDKVVFTVNDVKERGYYLYYVFNNNNLTLSKLNTDKYTEPLSVYIEQARAEGQNEAWRLVRKIFDMETNDIEDIFIKEDAWNLGTVLNNYTYQEAAAKVEAWEKAKEEIKVGDEVEKNDLRDVRFIVTFTNGRLMNGVTQSGLVFANEKPKEWHKTGRHIDIDGFLKQIGEAE